MKKKTISEVMSHLGKLSRKKHPISREKYSEMGKKGGGKNKKKVIPTS